MAGVDLRALAFVHAEFVAAFEDFRVDGFTRTLRVGQPGEMFSPQTVNAR